MRKLVRDSKQNVFHVAETSNEVRAASETVNDHAENISSAISEINTGVSLQKKEADECQEKMDILSSEIKTMVKEIESIKVFADSSHDMIKSGISQMNILSDSSISTTKITENVVNDISAPDECHAPSCALSSAGHSYGKHHNHYVPPP